MPTPAAAACGHAAPHGTWFYGLHNILLHNVVVVQSPNHPVPWYAPAHTTVFQALALKGLRQGLPNSLGP